MTILTVIIISYFTFEKMKHLISQSEMDVFESVETNHFDQSYEFNSENGFNVAVMVSSYDAEKDTILDPTYGHIIFEYSTWGQKEDGSGFFIEKVPIGSHYCSPEELGLTEDKSKSKFLPIKEEFK